MHKEYRRWNKTFYRENCCFQEEMKSTNLTSSINTSDESCNRNYFEMFTFLLAISTSLLSNATFSMALRKLHAPKENKFHLVVKMFAVSNTLVVAPLLPVSIASYVQCTWIGGYVTCALTGVISATFLGWSVTLMLILCFYRFLAICRPFYYRTKLTAKRTKVIMSLSFLWSAAHLSLPLFGLGRFRVHQKGWYCSIDLASTNSADILVVYLIIAEGILFTLVLGHLYLTVRKVVKTERRASMQLSPEQSRGANVLVIGRKRDEFARMTLLIAVVYWTCSFPYLSYRAAFVFSNGRYHDSDAYFYTQMIAYFNSFLNIVVFLVMNKQYRKAMKRWLGIRSTDVANNQISSERQPQHIVSQESIDALPAPIEMYFENRSTSL
ncbi:red-sensitive opsin-like [Dendronephthya gigantea]|uniref:red-sensitive opsin-like n=1 Tax=Dendronephthya gigantea TaxID=151771 RepID=UPI001069FC10|nr:red-sensitive opsin-like [Dendronephthya gigantea]